MNDSGSITEDSIEKIIGESNKSTFLPNNEQIKFHSIILLELFTFEDFQDLIKGLDTLYGDLVDSGVFYHQDRFEIEDIKKELNNPSNFRLFWKKLPTIYNSRFYDYTLFGVSRDLGDNFCYLAIDLHHTTSNLVMMKIDVGLTSEPSNKLNTIIYKEYTKDEVYKCNTKDDSESIIFPNILKEKEIYNLKMEIKKEILDFLPYLKGRFIKLSENDPSIVPSIDLYSLNYPERSEDIIKWGLDFIDFLNCLGIYVGELSFKRDRYILCEEKTPERFKYSNFVLIANRSLPVKEGHDIDGEIENGINFVNFGMLAFERLTNIHKDVLRELNITISNEIQNLGKDNFSEVIESRKRISKRIYNFKRFKMDFEQLKFKSFWNIRFESLETLNGKRDKLDDVLLEGILEQINTIDNTIDVLNQNANFILNLKNIEYAKKTQDQTLELSKLARDNQKWTLYLSIIVGILAVIQVILAYIQLRG